MTLKKRGPTLKALQNYSLIPLMIFSLAATASASAPRCYDIVQNEASDKNKARGYKAVDTNHDRSRGYKFFGANITKDGTRFSIWAPNAKAVEVILEADGWKIGAHPLTKDPQTGNWSAEIPGVGHNNKLKYKYRLIDANNEVQFRNDPYARYIVRNEATRIWDSVIQNPQSYKWQTQKFTPPKKLRIMEVNPRTRVPNKPNVNFRELAKHLIPILKDSQVNTISLMPITHHNVVESWGYQPGGIFAVNYRHGKPDDLKYFIDQMHKNGIAVIFDIVLGHASKDTDTGIGLLDGTQLYFSKEPYLGEHNDWKTYIYDFRRPEVHDFLLSNVKYWIEEFKIDGMRLDGLASMIFLDFSRNDYEIEQIRRQFNTTVNFPAIEFIKRLNTETKKMKPTFITIAEASGAIEKVTFPVEEGGLGFDYMWGMGAMHHMRQFLGSAPEYRDLYHILAPNNWNEKLIFYVNSHDEVANGKQRYIEEIHGASGTDRRFDVARVVTMWMYTMRGHPMLFQGDEFAEGRWWSEKISTQESLKQYPLHSGFEKFVRDLGSLHEKETAFERMDYDSLEVLNVDNLNKVLTIARKGQKPEDTLLIIMNFGDTTHKVYKTPTPHKGRWEIVFDSDAGFYGGAGTIVQVATRPGPSMNNFEASAGIHNLPARTGLILKLKNK